MDVTLNYIPSTPKISIPVQVFHDMESNVTKGLVQFLGRGTYAKVYKFEDEATGLSVALKRILISDDGVEKEVDKVREAVDINSEFTHKNIVQYMGCYKPDNTIFMILEFMNNGSLKEKLKNLEKDQGDCKETPLIPCDDILRYTHDILSGLQFIHSRNIIHRDLRSANILLSNDTAKIADFGIFTEMESLATKSGFGSRSIGNTFWCAPEMMEDEPVTDGRMDVWSLGVVILEMIYNVPPFMRGLKTYMKKLCFQNEGPDIPTVVTDDVQEILKMCFTFEVNNRMHSTELLEFLNRIYTPAVAVEPEAYDLFLSHAWGDDGQNHNRVEVINKQLKNLDYVTWFDTDPGRIQGDVQQAMCRGIEKTGIALVFITKSYHDRVNGYGVNGRNDNCYLEFKHLVTKLTSENMLSVIMERGMKKDVGWNGVLGMNMAGRIYVDMSGDLNNKQYLVGRMRELYRRIEEIKVRQERKASENVGKQLQEEDSDEDVAAGCSSSNTDLKNLQIDSSSSEYEYKYR